MEFASTRDPGHRVDATHAIEAGLAPDGGLYVPERFPEFEPEDFAGCDTLPEIGARLLAPFFEHTGLSEDLPAICRDAFSFPVPLRPVPGKHESLSILEMFHGPTAAFKDIGARFLAACLERLNRNRGSPLTILVATSGDTGGAVAAAFDGRANIRVVILYPDGLISARQEKQLTCWSGSVTSLAVTGTFDDCQRLAKQAFQDAALRRECRLSSANSISIGRLLPQTVYHSAAGLWTFRRDGRKPGFIVPSGNLGNGLACVWARRMGLPIGPIVLATNANRPIPDYLDTGSWTPRASVATHASAMDIGNPSNMERLMQLVPDIGDLRAEIRAYSVSDAEIESQIARDFEHCDEIWCPHTATALKVFDSHLSEQERTERSWVAVATAHPAKFESIVEPLIGSAVPIPDALGGILDQPSRVERIAPDFAALKNVLSLPPEV